MSLFRDRDLALRAIGALLPPRLGYELTLRFTPMLGASRLRWIVENIRGAMSPVLRDDERAAIAAQRFAGHAACDDLDAITAIVWPRWMRLRAVHIEGAETLPPPGRAVFVSFHLSGGFRIFDVLTSLGFRPGVIAERPTSPEHRYERGMIALRLLYWQRWMPSALFFTGMSVPRSEVRSPAPHLRDGGALVALLDVPVSRLGTRDTARVPFLGRTLEVPNGILRLAIRAGAPIVVFDGRLERGRRILRFHPPILGTDAQAVTAQVVEILERVVRERPWDWHNWLGLNAILAPA